MNPRVTVIIPAYNCEKTVMEAVQSALTQTEESLELLVIDDCSSDDTYRVLEELAATDSRIEILQNPLNVGVAETRNRGMGQARGRILRSWTPTMCGCRTSWSGSWRTWRTVS